MVVSFVMELMKVGASKRYGIVEGEQAWRASGNTFPMFGVPKQRHSRNARRRVHIFDTVLCVSAGRRKYFYAFYAFYHRLLDAIVNAPSCASGCIAPRS